MKRRRNKSYKSNRTNRTHRYAIIGAVGLIAVLLLAIFLKPALQDFFSRSFIRFDLFPETSPIGPIGESASTALQGSFTELFSGAGWKNPINSTVYQDFKTLTVSFPLSYEISPISPISPIGPINDTVAIGSRTFKAEVRKNGEQYEGYLYEVVGGVLVELPIDSAEDSRLFTSQYPGKIVLASDGVSKIFLLYAAYQGNAFEITVNPPEDSRFFASVDYSNIFNARVMEEGKIDPRIFYKDGAWWIYSVSDTPKLLRLRGGMASDLTDGALNFLRSNLPAGGSTSPALTAAPADEANSIYIRIDSKVFFLRDLGFEKEGKLVWESLRLNAWEGEVVRGRFTRITDSESLTFRGLTSKNSIKYFLSNDGGRHWVEAKLNEFVDFETKGGDFRWRAELYPSDNQYESPWIKIVGVEYYIVRD